MRAAVLLAGLALAGCGRLGGVIGGGTARGAFDAHVIVQQRDGCTSLVARTLRYGYTVLTPLGAAGPSAGPSAPRFELSGIFEAPVREGESVVRYTPPDTTPVWSDDEARDVAVYVHAVRLDLPAARAALLDVCDLPAGTDGPADGIPRLPGS